MRKFLVILATLGSVVGFTAWLLRSRGGLSSLPLPGGLPVPGRPKVKREAWGPSSWKSAGVEEKPASPVARSQHESPMRVSEQVVDTAHTAHTQETAR